MCLENFSALLKKCLENILDLSTRKRNQLDFVFGSDFSVAMTDVNVFFDSDFSKNIGSVAYYLRLLYALLRNQQFSRRCSYPINLVEFMNEPYLVILC